MRALKNGQPVEDLESFMFDDDADLNDENQHDHEVQKVNHVGENMKDA